MLLFYVYAILAIYPVRNILDFLTILQLTYTNCNIQHLKQQE
jgi:hypothetical protein